MHVYLEANPFNSSAAYSVVGGHRIFTQVNLYPTLLKSSWGLIAMVLDPPPIILGLPGGSFLLYKLLANGISETKKAANSTSLLPKQGERQALSKFMETCFLEGWKGERSA